MPGCLLRPQCCAEKKRAEQNDSQRRKGEGEHFAFDIAPEEKRRGGRKFDESFTGAKEKKKGYTHTCRNEWRGASNVCAARRQLRRWRGPPLFEEKKVLTLLLVHLGLRGTRCGAKGFLPAQSAHTYSAFFSSLLVRSPILARLLTCLLWRQLLEAPPPPGGGKRKQKMKPAPPPHTRVKSKVEKQLSLSLSLCHPHFLSPSRKPRMTLGLWMTSFLLPLPNPGMSPLAAAVAVAFSSTSSFF